MDSLVLGWKVTRGLEPQYWLNNGASCGHQRDDELVSIPADSTGTHTVIIGQSGSGKSSFLGRLVEELLLHTKARCVVLDTNGDFRMAHKVESEKLWKQASYDPVKQRGKLPHEPSISNFKVPWAKLHIQIITMKFPADTNEEETDSPYKRLQVWWPSLSSDFISEDLAPMSRGEIYHCHAFVQAVARLTALKCAGGVKLLDPIDTAEELYRSWFETNARNVINGLNDFSSSLAEKFSANELLQKVGSLDGDTASVLRLRRLPNKNTFLVKSMEMRNRRRINTWITRASTALQYVTKEAGRFYFAKAHEFKATGIFTSVPQSISTGQSRLSVIDLPSLPDRTTRLLITSAILEDEWNRARDAWDKALEQPAEKDKRVPTFIVMDEAHNYTPLEPRNKAESALKEQLRTMAAEGRKFGIFLIVASQRPDKLDPFVISECENKALMKLESQAVLDQTCHTLGLEESQAKLAGKCLEFGIGCAFLTGHWAQAGPQLLYSAARRTVEGGRSLRSEYWAAPP